MSASKYYCCTPRNITCKGYSETICSEGQTQRFDEYCEEQELCPIHTNSLTAISSNCSHKQNHFCPVKHTSSKICIDKLNVSVNMYCDYKSSIISPPTHGKLCPMAKNSIIYEQCYSP